MGSFRKYIRRARVLAVGGMVAGLMSLPQAVYADARAPLFTPEGLITPLFTLDCAQFTARSPAASQCQQMNRRAFYDGCITSADYDLAQKNNVAVACYPIEILQRYISFACPCEGPHTARLGTHLPRQRG